MNMKKILAAALCAALLLCFAGCDNGAGSSTTTQPSISAAEPAGVLFVSVGTEFKVIYDSEGLVMSVDSINSTAAEIIATYDDPTGKACDTVVSDLIKKSIEAGKHPSTKVVVLKQAADAEAPSANFLEDIRIDAAAAATGFETILVKSDELTEDGSITAETAKAILSKQFALTDVTVNCSAEPTDGMYVLTYEKDGAELEYEVDATTGSVILESLPAEGEEVLTDEDLGLGTEEDPNASLEEDLGLPTEEDIVIDFDDLQDADATESET